MANTVYGPFTAINIVNGTTPANATWGNLVQTQSSIALHGFNPSLIGSGFVYSGVVCTKDASVANQLDIASGVAYVVMSDGTVGEIAVAADTSHTTSGASVTWHLYLQPDGTWYWSTSNAPATNSLHICDVTTDGSGNILTVTDQRVTSVAMGSGAALVPTIGGENVAASVTPSQAGVPAASGVTFGGAALVSGDNAAKSASFDGTSGYVAMASSGLPTGAGTWTLEAWVRPTNATNATNASVLELGDGGTSGHSVTLAQVSTGGWTVAGWGLPAVSGGTSAAGVLHHVAATYDGASLRLYVDGALVAGPTAQTLSLTGPHAAIGATWSGSAWINFFPGSIAEAAVYSTTLSAARITAHFTAGTAGAYAATIAADSPVRYYRLNEPSGASWANSSIPSTVAARGSDGSSALGRVASVGGAATAGTLGVSTIVAQAIRVNVTSTGFVTILSYTAPETGMYRVSAGLSLGSTDTGTIAVSFEVDFVDPDYGGILSHFTNEGAKISASNLAIGAGYAIAPVTFMQRGGSGFSVLYQNAATSVSDYVSVVIERLS